MTVRRRQPGQAVTAMAVPVMAKSPLSRVCPKCEAPVGNSCRRWNGGKVKGQDVGGGYWVPLKVVHVERRVRRTGGQG